MSVTKSLRDDPAYSISVFTYIGVTEDQISAFNTLDVKIRKTISEALGKRNHTLDKKTISVTLLQAVIANTITKEKLNMEVFELENITELPVLKSQRERFKTLFDRRVRTDLTITDKREFLILHRIHDLYYNSRMKSIYRKTALHANSIVNKNVIKLEDILKTGIKQAKKYIRERTELSDFVSDVDVETDSDSTSSSPTRHIQQPEYEKNIESDSSSTPISKKRQRESESAQQSTKRFKQADDEEIISSMAMQSPFSSEDFIDVFGMQDNDDAIENGMALGERPQNSESIAFWNPVGIDSRYGINY
jgi:hypothetical protein